MVKMIILFLLYCGAELSGTHQNVSRAAKRIGWGGGGANTESGAPQNGLCEEGLGACSQEILRSYIRGPNKKSKNEWTQLKYAEIQEPSDLVCKLQLQ